MLKRMTSSVSKTLNAIDEASSALEEAAAMSNTYLKHQHKKMVMDQSIELEFYKSKAYKDHVKKQLLESIK